MFFINKTPGKQRKHGHLFFGRSGLYMVTLFEVPNISRFDIFW